VPYLNETFERPLEQGEQKGEDDKWFEQNFINIEKEIAEFEKNNQNYDKQRLDKIKYNIAKAKEEFNSRKNDYDTRMTVRDVLRKQYADLDNLSNVSEWPSAVEDLQTRFNELKQKVESSDNPAYKSAFKSINNRMESVIASKDVDQVKELKEQIGSLFIQILDDEMGVNLFIGILVNLNDDFDSQSWSDRSKARSILNNALRDIDNLTRETALGFCQQLWRLLPDPKAAGGRDDILGN
jgi:hypothetical protein